MKLDKLFAFLVLLTFTSCQQNYKVELRPLIENASYRSLEIESNSDEFRPVVKLVMIVDNSSSMAEEQSTLATGVGEMLNSLRQNRHNVDFLIYTTSSLNEVSPDKNSVGYWIEEYHLADNSVRLSPPTAGSTLDYTKKSANYLRPSLATENGLPLKIRLNMSDAEFATAKNKIVQVIRDVGISGSTDEAGLCAMTRILAEDKHNAVLSKGDRAVFLFLTDDQDYSTLARCTKSYSEPWTYYSNEVPDLIQATQTTSDSVQWWNYSANFKAPDGNPKYSLKASYYDGERFTVKMSYFTGTGIYSLKPGYWEDSYSVHYTYNYKTTCIEDGQPYPCSKTKTDSTTFNPSDYGITGVAASLTECPEALSDYVLLQADATWKDVKLSSCGYKTTSTASTLPAVSFQNSDYPNLRQIPSSSNSSLTCTAELNARAQTLVQNASKRYRACTYSYNEQSESKTIIYASDLEDAIAEYGLDRTRTSSTTCPNQLKENSPEYASFLNNRMLKSCTYSYSNSEKSITKYFASPQHEMTSEAGGICSELTPNLVNYAKSVIPREKSFKGCSYTYTTPAIGATSSCNYSDSPSNVAANLCQNSTAIETQLRSSCSAASGKNLVTNTCTRTAWKNIVTPREASVGHSPGSKTILSLVNALKPDTATSTPKSDSVLFQEALLSKSKEMFGEGGFYIAAIIGPQGVDACPGQAPGTLPGDGRQYRDLVQSLGPLGFEASICDDNYSGALAGIENFVVHTMVNTYTVPIADDEEIDEVSVNRAGLDVVLVKNIDYSTVGGTITFANGVIKRDDVVGFSVLKKTYTR